MKGIINDFKTGWIGVNIGIKNSEIDDLIKSLEVMKTTRSHFHLRSTFEGDSGIADVEFYSLDEHNADNLSVDSSQSIPCDDAGV